MEHPKAAKSVGFSKKKFNDYKTQLEVEFGVEISSRCCERLCEIFSYDPEAKTSDPEKSKHHIEWRKKKAKELGINLYQINKGIKKLNLNNQSTIQE